MNPSDTPQDTIKDIDDAQQVDDPGEYNQRLRLKELAQARRNARTALGGEMAHHLGDQWPQFAFREVQSLTSELEWMIRNQNQDEYFDTELGPITFPPPSKSEISKSSKERFGQPVASVVGGSSGKQNISVKGLLSSPSTGRGFLELTDTISESWEVSAEVRHKGPQKFTVEREVFVPMEVTKKAHSLCRKFMYEAGLDARIEEQVDEDPNPV